MVGAELVIRDVVGAEGDGGFTDDAAPEARTVDDLDWASIACGRVVKEVATNSFVARDADERDDLPPTLSAYVINAMQAPHEVLDVHPKAPPWATRDNLRVNCLRLLARRERHFEAYVFRALAAHDAKHGCPGIEARPDRCAPHAAALVAHALLAARATKRTEDLVQRLPRLVGDGHFDGSPDDALHARRPLGAPRSRRRRASGLLATRCVGARWALDPDRTAILEFDFEVSYCGRVTTVESAPAEAVADALARLQATELRELRLVDAASYRALKPLCRVGGVLQGARKQEVLKRISPFHVKMSAGIEAAGNSTLLLGYAPGDKLTPPTAAMLAQFFQVTF